MILSSCLFCLLWLGASAMRANRAYPDTVHRHECRLVEIGGGRGQGSAGNVDVEFFVGCLVHVVNGVLMFYLTGPTVV